MTHDELAAYLRGRIAELETARERVVRAWKPTWQKRPDPVDSNAEARINGQLAAYRDVLGRLPGAENDGQS